MVNIYKPKDRRTIRKNPIVQLYNDQVEFQEGSDSEYAAPLGWARPATRGELRDKLRNGVACEVAAHVAEMTGMMLRGWLDFDAFTVRPSDNAGWTLFEPNTHSQAEL